MVPSYKPPTVLRTTALKVVKMSPRPVQFFSVLLTSSPRFVPPSPYSSSFLFADIENGWNPGIIVSIVNLTESSGRGASERASRVIHQLC